MAAGLWSLQVGPNGTSRDACNSPILAFGEVKGSWDHLEEDQ
jgi:hypothetical protein